jgi:hypothetical protein
MASDAEKGRFGYFSHFVERKNVPNGTVFGGDVREI